MDNNEVMEKNILEEIENNSTEMILEENKNNILSFDDMRANSNTKTQIFTNINDNKKLFNLENDVDNLLNDCVGEKIRVKEVLIKCYKKPMKNPIIDEETGEVIKDTETTMSCVLIDDNNKSYATGSKMFTMQLMRYIQNYGDKELKNEGLEIEIIKKSIKDSNNKALGFKLI